MTQRSDASNGQAINDHSNAAGNDKPEDYNTQRLEKD
jgi:hypothetical protein